MRRGIILVVIIALLLTAGILSCACEGTPNNEDLQVVDWQEYLYKVAVAIDLQFLGVDLNEDIICDFALDLIDTDSGDKYECVVKLNLDLQHRIGQQGILKIDKISGDDRRTVLQVYNQDDLLYWLLYDEETGEYTRTRFDNAPILYTLTNFTGLFGENFNYSTVGEAFISLGKVFFTDATANADHSVYTFDFDLKNGLDNAFTRDNFAKLPKVLQKLFFSLAGVENYQDMLSKTPSLKGKVNIYTNMGKLSAISSEILDFKKGDEQRKVKFDIPNIIISNGVDESIGDYCPDDGDYGSGRLSDLTSIGYIKLENTQSDKVEMQYDYELRSKIDWVELLAEGGDLTRLDDDNFFHLKVSHICDGDCGAFCKDKYDPAKGAILDIAFSPKDFGTHDIYISVGLRALIGSRVISQFFSISESFLTTLIPEYWLTVISADMLSSQALQSLSEDGENDDDTIFWKDLLVALIYNDDGISASIEKILQLLGMNEEETSIVTGIFNCDGYNIDTLTLEQNYYRWNVSSYDVKRSAIHLYGNDIAGTKQYTKGFISRPPALTYDCESGVVNEADENYKVVRLFNDEYVSGILHDANTPMSADETEKLIGSYAHAQAEDIYGDVFDTQLYVAGHSAIDLNFKGWQRVDLYCMSTGRGYIDGKLWETIREYSWSRWLCQTVTTYIKLEDLQNVEYCRSEGTEYMQGEKLKASDTPEKITAILNYGDGRSKNIYITATNASDLLLLDSTGNRYISGERDTMLQFYLFGKYYGTMIRVKPAKNIAISTSVEELSLEYSDMGYSSQIRVGKLTFTLADDSKVVLTLSKDNIKINGYALDEVNEYFYVNPATFNPSALSQYIVIRKTGKYTLSFSYRNLEKSIPLYIQPKSEKRDESKYQIENTTNVNSNYFEGYTYEFSANISNTYHGEWGISSTVTVQILKGYINSSGILSYREPENASEYFNISEIKVDGDLVDNGFALELPPTIYGYLPIKTRVQFLKRGYYKVRIKLGNDLCEQEVWIEQTFE